MSGLALAARSAFYHTINCLTNCQQCMAGVRLWRGDSLLHDAPWADSPPAVDVPDRRIGISQRVRLTDGSKRDAAPRTDMGCIVSALLPVLHNRASSRIDRLRPADPKGSTGYLGLASALAPGCGADRVSAPGVSLSLVEPDSYRGRGPLAQACTERIGNGSGFRVPLKKSASFRAERLTPGSGTGPVNASRAVLRLLAAICWPSRIPCSAPPTRW